MVHAFVMVLTDVAASESLLGTIRDLPPVAEAHIVAGNYDLIVEVSTDEVYEVLQTTTSEIQSLDGVLETKTYISLED
ncbi:MAG: Lrp/AsnC ligand binding domain-containing protein [Halohasta sp.]